MWLSTERSKRYKQRTGQEEGVGHVRTSGLVFFYFFKKNNNPFPKWGCRCWPGRSFLLEAKGRVRFHHHHLHNFTDRRDTALECPPLPQARPICAHVVPWHCSQDEGYCCPLTEGPQGHRAAQLSPLASSLTTSCSHLLPDKELAQQIGRKPSLSTGVY